MSGTKVVSRNSVKVVPVGALAEGLRSAPALSPQKALRVFAGFGFIGWIASGQDSFVVPQQGRLWQSGVMERKRLHVFYSGHVQGVGFRYTVKALARGFEVTGIVRNLPDGRVELAAEGAKEELEAFREAIGTSELAHFISKADAAWEEARGQFRGFEIVR